MKAVYLLIFALLYLSVSAQDICPCQENNYQFSQYSWNQMETSDLETAYMVPERTVTTLQLVSEQEPVIETPPPITPSIEKEEQAPESLVPESSNPPVRATTVSSTSRSSVTSGKKPRRPNPRFRKSKRKGKKKYRGTCPKI